MKYEEIMSKDEFYMHPISGVVQKGEAWIKEVPEWIESYRSSELSKEEVGKAR